MIHPTFIPYLAVRDTRASITFYHKVFDFIWKNELSSHQELLTHVEMRYKDVRVMFAPETAWETKILSPISLNVTSPSSLHVYCDDVDAFYAGATEEKAKCIPPPEDSGRSFLYP